MPDEKKKRTYVYEEAANGMLVRVPLDKYAEWKEAQERLRQGDPATLEQVRKSAERLMASVGEPVSDDTSICPHCGKTIPVDSSFCPFCGKDIESLCRQCKKAIPDDSKFCPFCGKAVDNTADATTSSDKHLKNNGKTSASLGPNEEQINKTAQQDKKAKPRKKVSKTLIAILSSVIALVLLFFGVYWGTYTTALKKVKNAEYDAALKFLFLPAITERHDPNLDDLIAAGQELQNGKITGYQRLEVLAKDGYALANESLANAKEQVYKEAIKLYKGNEKGKAQVYFNKIDPYKKSGDYLILIGENNYGALLNLIGFEDANQVILDVYGEQFMDGIWETTDKKQYFSLDSTKRVALYNLPCDEYLKDAEYTISDQCFCLFDSNYDSDIFENYDKWCKKQFDITIVDYDTINIHFLSGDYSYTLYRSQN